MSDHNIAIRRFQCRHIFTGGRRCGSPCLRNEEFCYYHHNTRRSAQKPAHDPYNEPPNQTRLTVPTPEDTTAIQVSVGEIIDALARNAIDPRRAGLMLYALQIASQNLKGSQPKLNKSYRPKPMIEDVTIDPVLGPLAPPEEFDEFDEEEAYGRPGGRTLKMLCEKMALIND